MVLFTIFEYTAKDGAMTPQQIYLELYKEYRIEIRHQETQRSTVSSICVGIAAALIGLNFQDRLFAGAKPYIGLLLINFSLVAILMLRKLYERFDLGKQRAQLFLKEIDKCLRTELAKDNDVFLGSRKQLLWSIWTLGDRKNKRKYPFYSYVRLHYLWESLLVGAGIVGIVMSYHKPLFPSSWSAVHPDLLLLFEMLIGPIVLTVVLVGSVKRERRKNKKDEMSRARRKSARNSSRKAAAVKSELALSNSSSEQEEMTSSLVNLD